MKISPSATSKKPKYPVLIVSAAVAAAALSSCQPQQQQMGQYPCVEPPESHLEQKTK